MTTAGNVAIPFWADSRPTDLFLCQGTGKKGVPPSVCEAAGGNASLANDEDVFAQATKLP